MTNTKKDNFSSTRVTLNGEVEGFILKRTFAVVDSADADAGEGNDVVSSRMCERLSVPQVPVLLSLASSSPDT